METKNIHINKLVLDKENPRFSLYNFSSETEIIDYMIENEKIKDLTKSIINKGYNSLGERVIVLDFNDTYIVLEGNRRIGSLKYIMNSKDAFSKSEQILIESHKLENIEIPCDIVHSRDDATIKITSKHISGIKEWTPTDKRVFYMNRFSKLKEENYNTQEAIRELIEISSESNTVIKNYLEEMVFLEQVYNATKEKNELDYLSRLSTDVIIKRIRRYLKSELNLEIDPNTLDFDIKHKKKEIYRKILTQIGIAVWINKIIDSRNINKRSNWEKLLAEKEELKTLSTLLNEFKGVKQLLGEEESTEVKEADEDKVPSEKVTGSVETDSLQEAPPIYKIFLKNSNLTINKENYDLMEYIILYEDDEPSEDSKELDKIIIRHVEENNGLVIEDRKIASISRNGNYHIQFCYEELCLDLELTLNIPSKIKYDYFDEKFSSQWIERQQAQISNKIEYKKINTVLSLLNDMNSENIGTENSYFISAFLLRSLLEYTADAYIGINPSKMDITNLPAKVKYVREHLYNKKKTLSLESKKSINSHDDIERLNGIVHDYTAYSTGFDLSATFNKYQTYLTKIFDELC